MPKLPASVDDGFAWVTGASTGIGAQLVAELVARGWTVAATARSADKLEALAAKHPGKVFAFAADVSDLSAMHAAFAAASGRLGPLGLVVANAGIYLPQEAPEVDPAGFEKTFAVNVMGAVHAAHLAFPKMAARGKGHFHIVSSATSFGGMPTSAAYGASKAALVNMAACWRIELNRYGVGVSVSTPGFVKTPAQDDTPFPKPFMISAERAAREIVALCESGAFSRSFPKRFTWMLKAIYALPRTWHLPIIRTQTGWDKRPKLPTIKSAD